MKQLTVVGDHRNNNNKHELIVYRVRVCTRCGHAACPMCDGIFCDVCIDFGYSHAPDTDVKVHPQCSNEGRCVYDEPDSEAVEEVSRQVFDTQAEFDAAALLINKKAP